MFKFYAGIRMHQKRVEHLLALNHIDTSKAQPLKTGPYSSELTLIGVQIWQGKAGKWNSAKFEYDVTRCYSMMKKVNDQLSNCTFVICSTESFNFINTEHLHLVYIGQADAMNTFLLSKCKYVIAHTNSIFNWAEFWGQYIISFLRKTNGTLNTR